MQSTLPLIFPPGVLQLHNPLPLLLFLFGGDVDLLDVKDVVGMGRDDPSVFVAIVVLGRANHQVLL